MKYSKLLVIAALVVIVGALFITSCDDRSMGMPDYEITIMTANPDTIYADDGVTYSEIKVTVKDDDGFAVTGEAVTFRSDLGNIIYEILTDSTGIATTTFWDAGEIGEAHIDAFISDTSQRVTVMIDETPAIESLIIDIPEEMQVAGSAEFRAVASNALGPVPNGTIVVFETDLGYFVSDEGIELGNITQSTTTNGIAKIDFHSSTQSGNAIISAQIAQIEDSKTMFINPGSAKNIMLTATPNEIQVNSGVDVFVVAVVEDNYHNAVNKDVIVNFTTTLGNISESVTTDSLGIAQAIFSAGVEAGLAEIEAVSDSASASTVVSVSSDGVYSIEYAFSGQVDIQLQGTGGNESFEIIVNLYDSSGNLIDDTEEVWFRFITGPVGSNINNQIYYPSIDSLSVDSDNGQAVVSVNSGVNPGTIALKAYTYNFLGQEVSATKSNIVVHSGPPNSIELTIGDFDSGENMGGGVWQIECAAIINDAWGNPVDYGTAVWFSLEDPQYPNAVPPADPDWATIGAESYVGNENAGGDSLSGVAYTYLNYEGAHTNDSLIVWVEVSGNTTTFTDSALVIMPIQFATVDLVATPIHVDWNENTNNEDSLSTDIRVVITDGQNNPINHQTVHFTCSLGMPAPDELGGDPYIGLTGVVGGLSGMLHKTIWFQKYECLPPNPAPPGTAQATIEAVILGTGISGQTTVTLYRYID